MRHVEIPPSSTASPTRSRCSYGGFWLLWLGLLPLPLLRVLGERQVALHARVELLQRSLALLGVLPDELHLLGEGVAALLHGLPFVAVLNGVVVDRYLCC